MSRCSSEMSSRTGYAELKCRNGQADFFELLLNHQLAAQADHILYVEFHKRRRFPLLSLPVKKQCRLLESCRASANVGLQRNKAYRFMECTIFCSKSGLVFLRR